MDTLTASSTPAPTQQRLAEARSLLFVPGDRPERFAKALASGADAVIIDLEDAVAPTAKAAARAAIAAQWPALSAGAEGVPPLLLRINAGPAADVEADLALAHTLPGLAALMVPKAESGPALAALHQRFGGALALLPLIETAAGLDHLAEVAAAPGVLRLAVGHIDFMADTSIRCSSDGNGNDSEIELLPLRFAVAMATRRHSLAAAIDGVTVQIADGARLLADTQRAARLGFGGKLCIHPSQPAGVHAAFAPTPEEAAWAERVVAASAAAGGAAVQLDGRMVDAPVLVQAQRVLARARAGAVRG